MATEKEENEGHRKKQDPPSLMLERIPFLDSLRSIAIIMVIGIHTLGYCAQLPQNQAKIISFIFHVVAVPVFFLVDGYLFTKNVIYLKSYSYLKYIRNSLIRLLMPWAIFTLTYTLLRYVFELTGFLKERLILGHSLHEIAISSYGSVYAPQMYFLFSLFLIRLFSPIVKKIILNKNFCMALMLFICYYAAYKASISTISPYLKIDGGQEPILHALWGMQFYLLGIVIYKLSEFLIHKKLFMSFLLLLVFVFFIQDKLGSYGTNLIQYLCLLIIFFFFAFFQNGFPLLNVIGRNTMGIYLIHAPIIVKGVSLILNKFVIDPMLSFMSVLFGTLVLSVSVVMVINFVPHGSLLFGTPYSQNNFLTSNVRLNRTKKN